MGRIKIGFGVVVELCCLKKSMNLTDLVNPNILSQPVYEPGRPIEDVARELGLDPAGIIKMASNENPLGTSPKALAAMREALNGSALYPDGGCVALREKLAARHGISADQIVVGNGSNELLELLGHVFIRPGDEVVMGAPAFIVYKLVTLLFGATPVEVPLRDHVHDLAAMAAAVTERTKMVFLPSPNNPTGTTNGADEMVRWANGLPEHVVVVIDEAYAEYLETEPDWSEMIAGGRPVVVLRTFSKIFGLAALRVGYGRMNTEVAALLQRSRQPFNVNAIAQAGALGALDDEDWVLSCRRSNAAGLQQLEKGLSRLGFSFVPSKGNFVLAEVGDAQTVFSKLQRVGVIVRPVGVYGLPNWVRITVGNESQNERVLTELERAVTG
ncbi:histidinol-phosphate transaminase [Opitutaceae bacterium]|nr:histidinol-phosphate transaminase [Opitutaceae bacterium]